MEQAGNIFNLSGQVLMAVRDLDGRLRILVYGDQPTVDSEDKATSGASKNVFEEIISEQQECLRLLNLAHEFLSTEIVNKIR